jgi:hypothetical protein
MAKAKRAQAASLRKTSPTLRAAREGLDLIDATDQRKMVREPDLKRELKLLRHSNDVAALAVLYDAYMAAADAIQGIEIQPRAEGVDLLNDEWNWLILKAWTVAEQLARMQPSRIERFVQTLFNSAISMGRGLDGANSVLKAAMAVGTAK